ncbi:TetR/AcrR family transcriptional regulator, partial [Streptomyces sp. NPDC054787]
VYVFRSIWYYTVGEILVRAHSARARANDEVPVSREFSSELAAQLPRLAALNDQWAKLASQDTYPQALRAFVDGLLAQATSTAPHEQDR